jgi:UMP-CMP kinase
VFGDQLELICTLHLFCDEQTCVQRLINRGQNSGRADDAEEIIKKRFNVFYNESIPVVESLKKITKMIEIDSTQSAEIVTENILRDVQEIIKK